MAKITITYKTKDGDVQLAMDAKNVPAFLSSVGVKGQTGANKPSFLDKNDIKSLKADSPEELVLLAIEKQTAKSGKEGVHVVYSGLNEELKSRFGVNPREVTSEMEKAGLITINTTHGGVRVKKA
jgi:hypothetical protein